MDLVLKIKELVAALRANDWASSIGLTLAILQMFFQGMQAPPAMKSNMKQMSSTASFAEFADELDACCQSQGFTADNQPKGPIIDAMLPILLVLLRKLIGL